MFTKMNYSKNQKEINWLIRDKYRGEEPESQELEKDLARLAKEEPLDYIIGWREFLGCQIDLTARPLIPREETEYWVKQVIKDIKSGEVLDLFAGSGCIGLAVLKNCPRTRVIFGEKEEKFCQQIKKNLKINKLKGKVVKSNIFSNITGQFDYILANPPYIPRGSRYKVQRSVLKWEPAVALFGGQDGLVLIKKFLEKAKHHLRPEGKIFMEFGDGQKTAITFLLKSLNYSNFEFGKDQFGKWRWVMIK